MRYLVEIGTVSTNEYSEYLTPTSVRGIDSFNLCLFSYFYCLMCLICLNSDRQTSTSTNV